MDLLTDGLLMAATLFAGGYCWILSRRVSDLKSLDKGLGGSIVTLTRQIELARRTLEEAQSSAGDNRDDLEQLVKRANIATNQLKIAVAAARDVDIRSASLERVEAAPKADAAAVPMTPPMAHAAEAEPVSSRENTSTPMPVARDAATRQLSAETEALRGADILAPRGETAIRTTLKAPPVAPPRTPDIPAILSESDAAAASDWTAPRADPAVKDPSEVPKPAAMPPMASPLRSRQDPEEPASETDIIEALSLLAAGGSR